MKLVIQIPCLNEVECLPTTLRALPSALEGFDKVELLVIDDGSTDGTAALARHLGVENVVSLAGHQGLARAFVAGLLASIERGADVIVNLDADNQYDASGITALVAPILAGHADIVVGARPIKQMTHFSPFKRCVQLAGSHFLRQISGTHVRDAPSGFRAISRDAALRLNVFGDFTYTIETILQASLCNLRVVSVPVGVNGPTRPSRLFRSNGAYIVRAMITVLNTFAIYRPLRFFWLMAGLFLLGGVALGLRYVAFMFVGEGPGHIQSVIGCAVLLLSALFMGAIGIVAHLQGINRRLLEEVRYLLRSQKAGGRGSDAYRPLAFATNPSESGRSLTGDANLPATSESRV